jgi:putative endonuclease
MRNESNGTDWSVYMVRCRDGALYTGIACDVERRFAEHQAGKGAKYLRGRGGLDLVFQQRVGSRGRALKIERAVKRLPKQRKEALAASGCGVEALLPGTARRARSGRKPC